MIGLIFSFLAGLMMSIYFRVGSIFLVSAVFFAVAVLRVLSKGSFEFADILILFAYLSALQGGFMLGSYLRHRRGGGGS
ncbi:hypothetical protein SAMN05216360_109135 [Methylobacterium phyllostachyos]|uniref:Uncharacterized protein n=1 Tax=Methylobacterium phyllostachyos TaxID=582672 RepID=A0A1H0CF47_9HYPH|nr:hypothetical protein [Methylobacterium phyllostachyos]SDN56472.1 hypothetical protein SAMN05216360_109135 [Methylobacterium phyllostachyos]